LGKKANWTDSDDLDLMFKNTYSPAFYKALHRHIHKQFRLRQAKASGNWKGIYYWAAGKLVERKMLAELSRPSQLG
jgi:hypothetical protein